MPERRILVTDIPRPSPQPRSAIPADDPQRKLAIVRSDGPQIRHISLVGDTYTILLTGDETGGRYCLIDAYVPPGRGPSPHRHDFEEMVTILEGEIEVTFRGKTVTARAGETINIPANAPHAFRNSADAPARMLIICTPAGMDQFFIAIGDPVDSRTAPPPKLSEAEVVERTVRIEALAPMYRIELVAMDLGVRGSGVRLKAGAKPDDGIRPEDLNSENDG
jgi:quercetin dioxygenase-like cupin family protein